jgi:hypothetical protein
MRRRIGNCIGIGFGRPLLGKARRATGSDQGVMGQNKGLRNRFGQKKSDAGD